MAVVEMRRVTIVGHQSAREAVLEEIQRLGAVQVDDVRDALKPEEYEACFPAGREATPALQREPADGRLEEERAQVQFALDLLDRFFRPKKGVVETFAGIRTPLSPREYEERATAEAEVDRLVARARELDTRLNGLQAREAALKERQALLAPWRDLDVPREDIHDTRLFRVALGEFATRGSGSLEEDLAAVTPAVAFQEVGRNRDVIFSFLCYPRADEEQVLGVARRHEWSAIALPSFTGTVAEELAHVERELGEVAPERQRIIDEVKQLEAERVTLYARFDHLRNELSRTEAKYRLGYTERLFVLRGWARARDLPRLERAVADRKLPVVLEAETPAPGETYPVDLENPAIVRPFEVITRVAGLPAAGALDPSPYLAPFFFVFFGLMLGDAGYGIALGLAGLWLVKRAKAVGLGRQLLYLLSLCGISTFIAGVLTGSWLGNLFGIPPLWFDPLKDPVKMLIFSVILGVIQIFVALGVKGYDNIRKGAALDALYDQGFWLLFLSGLLLLLLSTAGPAFGWAGKAGKYVSLAGAIALILTQGRSNKNILARLGSGVLSLYGVSAYMSDVLSYSRLLALGLSGTVIAMVLNFGAQMAKGVPVIGWLFFLVILVAGHIFNLLISAVGAYVHASRLQYVEFFTKFFEAGGRPFKPLEEGHRYVFIESAAEPGQQR
ncbi:MAG: V-type ATP synthase subunit I [Chitinophagales bacterium]